MARRQTGDGNLVLENTRPCAIFLPPAGEHRRKMLMPGQNDVSAAHYLAVRMNKAIKMWVAMGYLRDLGPGKAVPLPTGLDGLSDAAAAEKLAQIDNMQLLTDLRDKTASGALRDLASQRIKELIESSHSDAGTPDA